jgi:hypothetical protein
MAIVHNKQDEYKHRRAAEIKIVDNKPVRFRDVRVHEIKIGDVEDPDIYVAVPMWDWQQTAAGKFVMEHAVDKPYWIRYTDPSGYYQVYCIMARFSEQNETFWRLKWDGLK